MMVRIIAYAFVFLVCVAVLAKMRSRPLRQATLLLASYGLYLTWDRWFLAVLLTSTVMNYLGGKCIRRKRSGYFLAIGILLNLALLSTFKYLPEASIHLPMSSLQRFAHLALPLGISFWTFQAMSYLFDVFQGDDAEPTFTEFALYTAFFPVTISGPVCRLPEMLPQFRSENPTRWSDITSGFRRIAVGALMMQFAKLLGQGILAGDGIVSGFDRVTRWTGADVWCLALGYGLQLFLDFGGYSHIAIGAARALGITIPENFARPFASTTASVFWTRWHMSLSFWIRDYVFFPLVQIRRELWWRNACFLIAMTLFGLWHKASLLFLLWGAYQGVLLILHRQVEAIERKYGWTPPEPVWTILSWTATMSMVNLGWIFFRADSWPKALEMLSALMSPATYYRHYLSGSLYLLVFSVALGYAFVLLVCDALDRYSAVDAEAITENARPHSVFLAWMARWRWYWIPPLYALALLFVSVVTLSRGANAAQMMYGQF